MILRRRNGESQWNIILKASKAKNGLSPFITELIAQLSELDDSLHFKACIEIFKYWNVNKNKTDKQLTTTQIASIKQKLKLKCGEAFYPASQSIISEYYSTDKRINEIMPSIILEKQISKEYQPYQANVSDWKLFFSLIGSKDLNSEQKIFNEKVDLFLVSQDNYKTNHFVIIREFDLLLQANQNAEIKITFDFANKFTKILLQTSITNTWTIPNEIHFPSEYKPELELQSDAEIQNQFKFLSSLYFGNKISRDFLNKLGVHSNFNFINTGTNVFQFYPVQLLIKQKYLPDIWKYITSSESNVKSFVLSNAFNIIKANSTIQVNESIFKKPTELFSKNLSAYIDDKNQFPLIDLTKDTINNSTLEMLVGINQELNINHCLALLKRDSPPKQQEVINLKLINILHKYKYTTEILAGIKLPNSNYTWLPATELYTSTDSEIISKHPNNLLSSDFNSVSAQLFVKNISSNDSVFHYEKDANSQDNAEIKSLFKKRAEYLAFIIKNGAPEYLSVSKQILTTINSLTFVRCDEMSNSINHGSLIWKKELSIRLVSSTIYFIDELQTKKSEIRKYLYDLVSKFGVIKEKVFNRYLFDDSEKNIIEELEKNYDSLPPDWKSSWIKEVEEFIQIELESTEWSEYIPELKNILELSKNQPKEKQKLYNLIAKLKLAKHKAIHFNKADRDYNQLSDGTEMFFVHSARGSFAYIHTNEILRMKKDGYKMALDFGSKTPIRIYDTAEDILNLNTSHLLAYQYEKSMEELFSFCEANKGANKHLLVIDKSNSREKSNDIFKLLNPEDDYQ